MSRDTCQRCPETGHLRPGRIRTCDSDFCNYCLPIVSIASRITLVLNGIARRTMLAGFR